jgi:hypothetical protein
MAGVAAGTWRLHRIRVMVVRAVIFDWGGTLTPWHAVDHEELWLAVCGRHYPASGRNWYPARCSVTRH